MNICSAKKYLLLLLTHLINDIIHNHKHIVSIEYKIIIIRNLESIHNDIKTPSLFA